MNKRLLQRAVLFLGLIGLLFAGAQGLLLSRSQQRQEALNRQLIEALEKSDDQRALTLVNVGADPNTSCTPPPPLERLVDGLLHRSTRSVNDSTALLMACGTYWPVKGAGPQHLRSDAQELVETMLQHGAKVNTQDAHGWTPLLYAVTHTRPKTVSVLLKYGADANAQSTHSSPLFCAVLNNKTTEITRELLTHGADANLIDKNGDTAIQQARRMNRPDFVALLK